MRLAIWVEEDGVTDQDLRDGDIFLVQPETWEPGDKEKKSLLIVDVEGLSPSQSQELQEPEWAPTPGDIPQMRRQRKYTINYAARLSPAQLADVKNPDVLVEPITGVFLKSDIIRKS